MAVDFVVVVVVVGVDHAKAGKAASVSPRRNFILSIKLLFWMDIYLLFWMDIYLLFCLFECLLVLLVGWLAKRMLLSQREGHRHADENPRSVAFDTRLTLVGSIWKIFEYLTSHCNEDLLRWGHFHRKILVRRVVVVVVVIGRGALPSRDESRDKS